MNNTSADRTSTNGTSTTGISTAKPVETTSSALSSSVAANSSPQKKPTFQDVYEQVQDDERGKWDTLVRRQDIVSKDGKLAFPLDPLGEYWESLTPSSWATAQLCSQLGIPATYFRRCPTVLQDIQFNYWLRPPVSFTEQAEGEPDNDDGFDFLPSENEVADKMAPAPLSDSNPPESNQHQRWRLRVRYGTLRAVLSERYSPLDNLELLKCLEPAWREHFRIDWFALDDETLHLRIVDPTLLQEGLPGDDLMAGVHISNSEVGKHAVAVDAMVFRQVCSNGLIRQVRGKSLLRQRHIHITPERFREQLAGAIRESLNIAAGFMSQFALTARHPVFDAEETLKRLGERWRLNQDVQAMTLHSMQQEPAGQQENVYALVNGLTRASQALSMDARYDLEVLAGRLAEQGLPSWAQVSGASRQMPVTGGISTVSMAPSVAPPTVAAMFSSPQPAAEFSGEQSIPREDTSHGSGSNGSIHSETGTAAGVTDRVSQSAVNPAVENANAIDSFDAVTLAQEMSEAEVVGDRPN